MSFASDFTKAPLQIVLDLINDANTSSITTSLITAGAPSIVNIAGRHTQLTLTAQVGSGYTGGVDFTYNRVDLATVPGSRSTTFQVGDATNLSDLIPEINTAYGLNLTAADYTDVAIPAFPGVAPHETQTIDLVAKAGSLVFIGTLTLTLDANDVALSSVLTVTALNGLTYVQPA